MFDQDKQLEETAKWANLSVKLASDPKTRKQFESLVKQVAPEIETTEDVINPALDPIRAELAELKKFKEDTEKGAREWNRREKLNGLKNHGYTDEGIQKIEAIMQERNISDPEVAAAWFDKTNPQPKYEPAPTNVFGFSDPGALSVLQGSEKDKLDMLFNDTDRFLEQEVSAVLNGN